MGGPMHRLERVAQQGQGGSLGRGHDKRLPSRWAGVRHTMSQRYCTAIKGMQTSSLLSNKPTNLVQYGVWVGEGSQPGSLLPVDPARPVELGPHTLGYERGSFGRAGKAQSCSGR